MSRKLGKTVVVKQRAADSYQVLQLKNTTVHAVRDCLSKSQIDGLIASGYDVTIK